MSTPVLRFTKGPRYLDLQSGRYRVMPNWAPPAVSEIPLMADGTSANRSGAILVDRRPANRQITLPVNVLGSTSADIRRGLADLQMFMSLAGDESEPLYLEFLPNSDMPEPLWGNYGVYLRYQVVSGSIDIAPSYLSGARIASDVDVTLTMVIKPYATGRPQRLASALGGIVEDALGAADGLSRGLIVPEATTNKATNPVFGHATYDNCWVTGPQLISEKNTDPRFILFGVASARLTCITSGTRTFCQSLNVGNTNTHMLSMYAKRQDGAAVTAADCQLVYNVLLTTTYTAVGDGWYRLTASAAGINAATAAGIAVAPAASVYVDGFQIEELAYATPLAYGDLLGCAWTGTAHASTSTRAAGRARLAIAADTFSVGAGAVRVVWRAPYANTHGGANLFLWSCGAATLRAYYQLSDDKFYFTDGTTSISTAAQTFAAGDVIVLHFVWGLAGIAIYKNGSSAASNGTYTPPAVPTYMYLGSSDTPNAQGYGPFMDVSIFSQALTAAQVLADYTNLTPLTTAGSRVGAIPWLWTKDGDDILDNCDDSTRDNWAAAGGIPGSAESQTNWRIYPSNVGLAGYWLMLAALKEFVYPTAPEMYGDAQGTADANSSGGEYLGKIITTVEPNVFSYTVARPHLITDRLNFFMRAWLSAGSQSCYINPWVSRGVGTRSFAPGVTRTIDTTARFFFCGGTAIAKTKTVDDIARTLDVGVQVGLWAGGSATIRTDFIIVVPGPAALIIPRQGSLGAGNGIGLVDSQASSLTAAGLQYDDASLIGMPIHLVPSAVNLVWFVSASDGGAHVITDTATLSRVLVTPRYSLL